MKNYIITITSYGYGLNLSETCLGWTYGVLSEQEMFCNDETFDAFYNSCYEKYGFEFVDNTDVISDTEWETTVHPQNEPNKDILEIVINIKES